MTSLAILAALSFQALHPGVDPLADEDGDGVCNEIEYCLSGRSLTTFEPPLSFQVQEFKFHKAFPGVTQKPSSGVRLIGQVSTNLIDWSDTNILPLTAEIGFYRLRSETCEQFRAWSDEVDSRLPSSELNIFSVRNDSAPMYVRSPTCWGAGFVDLTPFSVWNSQGGAQMAGTLISRRHVLFATHWRPPVGSTLRWVDGSGVAVDRTLVGVVSLPETGWFTPDITIGLLGDDMPSSVGHVTLLPANFQSSLPTWDNFNVPAAWINQERKLGVADIFAMHSRCIFTQPWFPDRVSMSVSVVNGDSGCPVFLCVSGRPVLLGLVVSVGLASGVTANAAAIQDAMNYLQPGHTLEFITLDP